MDELLILLRTLLIALQVFIPRFFSAEEVDRFAQRKLLSKVSVRLSVEQSAYFEGELSVEECLSVLQGMAHWKAPGNDGLPMEFYVKFGTFWVRS